jgi:chaperonin GroES
MSNKLSIKPLAGYVLVEAVGVIKKTASGIYVPEASQEKQAQGKVVSVGNPLYVEGREIVSPVKVGDVVFYKKWGGDEIKVDDKELKLVKFDELMAIMEK